MTTGEAIKKAMLLLGVVDRFGEPTANEYSDGLVSLNQLLRRLGVDRYGVHTTAEVSHTLTPADGTYTIGIAGDIVTPRPHKILSARITNGDIDYSVDVVGRSDYDEIQDKATSSQPCKLFYDPTPTTGTIYLYPVPDAAYTLKLTLQQPLTEYTSTTTVMAIPEEYLSHIPWALAIDLAPEYRVAIPEAVVVRAQETLRQLKRLHATPTKNISSDPFCRDGRSFDILAGV